MKKTETQQVLDALKLLDPELSFSDWENADGENIGPQLCAAVALLQADLARVVEPAKYLADATRFKVALLEKDCRITNLPRELGGRWVALVAAENDCHLVTPQEAVAPELTKEELTDLIASGLGCTYHCTRVWSAWNVGTMSQNDFEPVDESDTPAEIADAIIAAINAKATA